MSADFEILDYRPTRLGTLMLRRRREPVLDVDVFEVKLGEEYLMSSLFHEAEIALSTRGLAPLAGREKLDVVVGGLGLGYTAQAALDHEAVASLRVIDGLPEVIEWHQEGLVPLGKGLSDDPRCRFVHADFFALAPPAGEGFGPVDAILLDIDHAPDKLLHESHAAFYTREGQAALAASLKPGGVFALWSNDAPDEAFMDILQRSYASAACEVIAFENPLRDCEETNSVYVARVPD